MSSAARFLLEFEATGDQEVVSKIKAVGAAGKETATDLESLRGIEDPFEPIATGAEAAVTPIEEVGTAVEGTVTPLGNMVSAGEESVGVLTDIGSAADTSVAPLEGVGTAMDGMGSAFEGAGTSAETFSGNLDAVGGAADAATGGLDPANTLVGDFGESASTAGGETKGFGDNVAGVAGTVTALGATIGSAVSSYFRYIDAQNRAEKSQLRLASATETYRKAEAAIDTILATATSNADGIAAARARLAEAQAKVNELMDQGVTSGEEYEAAVTELQAAQAGLAQEAAKGGVDVGKLTSAMEKAELGARKMGVQAKTVDKDLRKVSESVLDAGLNFVAIAGNITNIVSGFKNMKAGAEGVISKLGGKAGVAGVAVAAAAGILSLVEAMSLIKAVGARAEFLDAKSIEEQIAAAEKFRKVVKEDIFAEPIFGAQLDKDIAGFKELKAEQDAGIATLQKYGAANQLVTGTLGAANSEFSTYGTSVIRAKDGAEFLSSEIVKMSDNMVTVDEAARNYRISQEEVNKTLTDAGKNTDNAVVAMGLLASGMPPVISLNEALEMRYLAGAKAADVNSNAVVAMGQAINQAGTETKKNVALSEEQSAALNKVTGSALETSKAAAQTGEAINRLTQADVDSIVKLQEHTREQIIANAGYNNAAVATLQYQAALTAMTQSLVDDTDQKNANAKATLALVDSELNAQNAIATVNEEYANSVDRLADLNTVLSDNEARTKAVATVSNEFAASLKEQSIELQGTLQALQDVENQEQGVANAILQTKVSLEESNQALREAKAVRDDMGASTAQLQTALNEEQTALIEEEAALQASIAAGNDSVIMRQRLDNAYLEGVNSIQEWNTELATSAEAEQGAIDALADFGVVFSKLPGYMAPTIENLQLVREAALGSGEAMQEMADMASENFQTMAGDANKFIGGMADTILEGGKDIEENWQKNWEEIPQAVRDSMSTAQQEEVKAIAEMQAAAEAAVIELGFDLNTEEFATARADFTANLEELAANSDGIWSQMWSRAAELASTGSEAMVARISEIVKSDDSPAIMLQNLEAAAVQFGPIGDSAGTSLMGAIGQSVSAGGVTLQSRFSEGLRPLVPAAQAIGNEIGPSFMGAVGESVSAGGVTLQSRFEGGLKPLVPKAKAIGTESGVALEQEFAKQIGSIVNTINTMQLKPIPFTADVSAVHQALATLTTQPPPMIISVDADIRAAQTKIGALTGTNQKPVMIYVDANISAAQTKISALTGTDQKPVMISVDADISAAQTKISALTGTNQTPIMIHVDADITAAQTKIGAIANQPPVMISVSADTSAAISQLDVIRTKISQLSSDATATQITITANTTQAVSAFNAASTSALTMRNNVNAAASGVKSAAAGAGSAVASFSSKASSSFTKAGTAGTQMASKVKSASSSMKSSLSSAASSAASFASKCVSSFNKVGSSASSNASKVKSLASAINSLKSKTITITTRYVTTGTRPAQFGMHETVNRPTMILAGEAGPERVDITPGGTGNNVEINHTVPVAGRGGGGGGNREIVIPVTLMLDNKVLIRTVRRGLVEEVSGAM